MLMATDDATASDLATTYGLVVYGAGLALSWVFHRSRAFVALAILAWLNIAIVGRIDRVDQPQVVDVDRDLGVVDLLEDRDDFVFGGHGAPGGRREGRGSCP